MILCLIVFVKKYITNSKIIDNGNIIIYSEHTHTHHPFVKIRPPNDEIRNLLPRKEILARDEIVDGLSIVNFCRVEKGPQFTIVLDVLILSDLK